MNIHEQIAVMQAYANGAEIETKSNFDNKTLWVISDNPSWSWGLNEYRVKVEKPSIDWSHVKPEFHFLAVDEDGTMWLYRHRPTYRKGKRLRDAWCAISEGMEAGGFASAKPGNCAPQDSLVERPEGM